MQTPTHQSIGVCLEVGVNAFFILVTLSLLEWNARLQDCRRIFCFCS